jgi:hypothetical protein
MQSIADAYRAVLEPEFVAAYTLARGSNFTWKDFQIQRQRVRF